MEPEHVSVNQHRDRQNLSGQLGHSTSSLTQILQRRGAPSMPNERNDMLWLIGGGLGLLAAFAVLALNSWRFGYDFEVAEMPVLAMVSVLVAAGGAFAASVYGVWCLVKNPLEKAQAGRVFWGIVLVGFVARALLATSEPILEDDYQRYLWDGAVTAAGYNPFGVVPEKAASSSDPEIRALAERAGGTLERVNHPDIRTIYPPGAQAFFALAHLIEPFSLRAWRLVVMTADVATFALVLLLLSAAQRSPLWVTLYWWNPLIIKELVNSVHMEAVLMPFILAAVWCAVRKRPVWAATAIGIAGAIKIWPLALVPVLLRAATNRLSLAVAGLVMVGLITAAWASPMIIAGLDQSAGVVAYAQRWRTNSGMFQVLLTMADLSGFATLSDALTPNHVARVAIALIILGIGLGCAIAPPKDVNGAIRNAALVAVAVFLLSPAQFPWYVAWIAPFLPFLPLIGFVALAVTMPLYYVAFHLMAIEAFPVFNAIVIWCVWFPVWGLLIMQLVWSPQAQGARVPNSPQPGET